MLELCVYNLYGMVYPHISAFRHYYIMCDFILCGSSHFVLSSTMKLRHEFPLLYSLYIQLISIIGISSSHAYSDNMLLNSSSILSASLTNTFVLLCELYMATNNANLVVRPQKPCCLITAKIAAFGQLPSCFNARNTISTRIDNVSQ